MHVRCIMVNEVQISAMSGRPICLFEGEKNHGASDPRLPNIAKLFWTVTNDKSVFHLLISCLHLCPSAETLTLSDRAYLSLGLGCYGDTMVRKAAGP